MYEIKYHEQVVKEDIPKLSSEDRKRVKKSIENKLQTFPDVFGKPLRRSLKGHRRLRVGDFRVVYKIQGRTVKILAIKHRSVVYRETEERT